MTVPPSKEVELSIVIPFKDAASSFADQLKSLAGQRFAGEWEVVLVDNESRDDSRAIGEGFADRLNLRMVDASDRPGAAHARVRHS